MILEILFPFVSFFVSYIQNNSGTNEYGLILSFPISIFFHPFHFFYQKLSSNVSIIRISWKVNFSKKSILPKNPISRDQQTFLFSILWSQRIKTWLPDILLFSSSSKKVKNEKIIPQWWLNSRYECRLYIMKSSWKIIYGLF